MAVLPLEAVQSAVPQVVPFRRPIRRPQLLRQQRVWALVGSRVQGISRGELGRELVLQQQQ